MSSNTRLYPLNSHIVNARERTRTSTNLRPLEPESSASTNSATRAAVFSARKIFYQPMNFLQPPIILRDPFSTSCYSYRQAVAYRNAHKIFMHAAPFIYSPLCSAEEIIEVIMYHYHAAVLKTGREEIKTA